MTRRIRKGGNSEDFQLMFLGDVDTSSGEDLSDGDVLAWDESAETFKPTASGGAAPYKVYTALLTQTGENAPVATVLQNTLGGEVIWERDNFAEGGGLYYATLTGAFAVNKTFLFSQLNESALVNAVTFNTISIDQVALFCSAGGIGSDGWKVSVEIRVYP